MTCTLLFDRQEDVGWKLGWTGGHLRRAALHLPRVRYLLFLRGNAACTGRERLRDRVRCDQIASLPRKMQPNRTHKWIGGRADGFAFLIPNNQVHPRWRCLIFISSRRRKGGEGRAGAMSGDLCSGSKQRRGGIADEGWRPGRGAGERVG
jgi:hypothetical protein